MIGFIFPVLVIIVIIVINYLFSAFPLKKVISELGGSFNHKGEGCFSYQGRDMGIRYIPGSRGCSPELRVYTKGNFGAEAFIRYENSSDRFYKQVGLNRELDIADREINDKLYFECDDQEFLNLLFLNPQTKSDVLGLLDRYSDIEITKGSCLLKLYPAPYIGTVKKEDIENIARELVTLSALVPSTGGNHPELVFFKIKQVLLYFLGGTVLGAGIISWGWASAAYRVVDAMRLWMLSLNDGGTIALAAVVLAFFIIRGFSTSSKVFIFFVLTFSIGAILCGRYGVAVYNGFYDRSPARFFDQAVFNKYSTTGRHSTTYHVALEPWRPGMNNWEFTVSWQEYETVSPGSTQFRVFTRSGLLGYEWVSGLRGITFRPKNFNREQSLSNIVNGTDLENNVLDIPINPFISLNGLSKGSVLNLRRQYVQQIPALAPVNYQPSADIFGKIQDGKPWWGMLGICYFGQGSRSIEGPSRESQYIANPYLLFGVESPLAYTVHDPYLGPEIFYPVPRKLTWDQHKAWAHAVYDVHDFYNEAIRYHYIQVQSLFMNDYNARDMGFNYAVIDPSLSKNIRGTTGVGIPIIEYIHTGNSCGYPGGCNNRSPTQHELMVTWNDLPARIYLKLYKAKNNDLTKKSDMDFIIDLI